MLSLAHLQLLDSALPVGAFAHSFGLETLTQQGAVRTSDDLRDYCRAMLFGSWGSMDVFAVKGAYELRDEELWRLDRMLFAARAARESREGVAKIGKRFLHLARSLHPNLNWHPLNSALESGRAIGVHATIYGWTCRELGFDLDDAARGFLYSAAASTCANAVRLMRIGQTSAAQVLAALAPDIDAAWQQVGDADPFDFWSQTPGSEIAALRHETLYSRLFMS